MGRKRRQPKQTRPQKRAEQRRQDRAEKTERQQTLRTDCKELVDELRDKGLELNIEVLMTMSATEAVVDLLIEAGVIERLDYNIARFGHTRKMLHAIKTEKLTEEEVAA